MKRVSGVARFRVLVGLFVLILVFYGFKNFRDYSNQVIHEVNKYSCLVIILPGFHSYPTFAD